ncbi:MAG: SUMF1/EgtB/PvdO family nonheme iron enzyme [Bryobacteraceae bacterium]
MNLLLLLAFAVDFTGVIAPILDRNCVSCHGAKKADGGLRVDTPREIAKSVVKGDPSRSSLYTRSIIPPGKAGSMPPGGPALTADELAALRAWIAEGAVWPAAATLAKAKPADDLALSRSLHARIAKSASGKFENYRITIPETTTAFDMVAIPGGEFQMGAPETEAGRGKDEGPRHKVKVEPFWMGKYEVTWNEFRLFMFPKDPADELVDAISRPTRPYVEMSFGMGIDGYPAISMTHHAANKYAEWLSARTGQFYRLPTEAEWEYACRAGTGTAYSFGDSAGALGEYAWFLDNANDKYQQVGKKKPNAWGLHDMHGNVIEWTLDQYLPDAYSKPGAYKPYGWVPSKTPYPHVARGGSWADPAEFCRCGARRASDSSWKMQDPQLPQSIWYHTDAQWLGMRLVRPRAIPTAEQMHAAWNSGVAE